MNFKKLNVEELIIGAVFGLVFAFKLGLWAVPLAVATSILWALGGAVEKNYRRVGCAVLPAVLGAFVLQSWQPLWAAPMAYGALCIGYGMPSTQPPDKGSFLGQLMSGWLSSPQLANVMTRIVVYAIILISFIPLWTA
jgi:hypothetical protein